AQNPVGAWERIHNSKDGKELKSVVIFSESHQSISIYESKTGRHVHSNGGTWELKGKTMTEVVEFDTDNPERVGSAVVFDINIDDEFLEIVGSEMKFSRLDNGAPGDLNGAWLMSARIRDGKKQERDISRPRKTMKILSGTRFQWIAYNTETKKFMATGGGTYTTLKGKYKENIEFFSRDNSKVGLNLEFDYEILIKTDDKKLVSQKNWYHKGFSSKGNPINEIWTQR
ncbi:membrane or secreted protein, partial [Flavobacteriaceae bacterium]|nr:membrane or secreted protein [Flavobacteriaceae bacterium]